MSGDPHTVPPGSADGLVAADGTTSTDTWPDRDAAVDPASVLASRIQAYSAEPPPERDPAEDGDTHREDTALGRSLRTPLTSDLPNDWVGIRSPERQFGAGVAPDAQFGWPGPTVAATPSAFTRVDGRRPVSRVLVVLAVLLPLVVCAYYAREAAQSRDAARTWQDKSARLDAHLASRTEELNVRTTALNRTSERLERSEQDVKALETRQIDLAGEKARVEDDRAALGEVADKQSECNTLLTELLEAFTFDDFDWLDANIDDVADTCAAARAGFESLRKGS